MRVYASLKTILSTFGLGALLIGAACDDDDTTVFEPTQLTVGGPDEVSPGDTATFTADQYENETYTWGVPATGATIIEGDGTSAITVIFTAAGSGDITVAARGVNGSKTVTVATSAPTASVALDSGVVLMEGETANVRVSFDQDIATAPTVTLVPADEVTGGAVSAVEQVDDRTFQVTYTAGAGDGTDQVSVSQAVTSEFFGSVAMDTVIAFDVYPVDNTPATGELFASRTPVSDSMMVTLSAMFSEPLSTSDSVQISVNGLTTTYVTDATMDTEDGLTWTYEFQPEGGANELATVTVSNLPTDLAGNATDADSIEPIIIQIKNEE